MKKKIKKLPIILSTAAAAGLTFSLAIYFSQTLYFYQMPQVDAKEGNNIQTIYSHDANITKKYNRTIAKTYAWDETYTKLDGTLITTPKPSGVDENTYMSKPQTYWPSGDYKVVSQAFYQEIIKWEDQTFTNVDWVKKQVEMGTLKKHPIADYQYLYANRVLDSTQAVEKIFNLDLTQPGFITTGLYIPAGETLTIDFPGLTDKEVSDLNLQVVIGENDAVNMNLDFSQTDGWSRGQYRMPKMKLVTKIDKASFKFGSPFGGIIHINNTKQQSITSALMTINGAIEALHYIHGYTTQEEWNRLIKEAQAPIYDVSSDHMKFIGPKHTLSPFLPKAEKREDNYYPYESIRLFDKMAQDALYTINDNDKWLQPVRHTFSNFVPYGAACSYVRAFYVVAPWSWSNGFASYESINTAGAWGIMHENNHQHQNGVWGFNGHGEVSNNVLTLISYLKYTDINTQTIGGDTGGHLYKLNGTSIVNTTNNQFNDSTANGRNGFDTDYSLLLSQFGVDALQQTIRSYSNTSTLAANGKAVTPFPTKLNSDGVPISRNAKFIYRMSEITGYNFAPYALNVKLITQADCDLINNEEAIKNLKEYIPSLSGYASYTKYNTTPYTTNKNFNDESYGQDLYVDKWDDHHTNFNYATSRNDGFKYVGRPNVIKKNKKTGKYENAEFNLKETDIKGYETTSVKLIKKPKGKIADNNDGSYTYTPVIDDKNYIDKFVYEKTVKSLTSNETVTTQFEVDIKLEENTTKFQNPDLVVPQYYNEQTNDETKNGSIFSKWPVDVDGKERPGKIEKNSFNSINEILNNTDSNKWWRENLSDDKNVIFKIDLKSPTSFNFVDITPWKPNDSQTPDGLIIKTDVTDDKGNGGTEIYNGSFYKSSVSSYSFSNVQANKNITLIFRKFSLVSDGVDPDTGGAIMKEKPRSTNLALRSIKFGTKTIPNQVFAPDSDWIHRIGDWRQGFNDGKINGKSLFTIFPQSKLQFGFYGTGFSIAGVKDKGYGSFDVYVDGQFKKTISTDNSSRQPNSPLYIFTDLSEGEHNVSILTKNSLPVEIQYVGVVGEVKPIQVNDWFYFMVVGIPLIVALVIALTVVSVMLYMKNKGKKIEFKWFKKHFKARLPIVESPNKQTPITKQTTTTSKNSTPPISAIEKTNPKSSEKTKENQNLKFDNKQSKKTDDSKGKTNKFKK